VFVFEEKLASMPLGYPGGENLWAAVFGLVVEGKNIGFSVSFGVVKKDKPTFVYQYKDKAKQQMQKL